MARHGDVVVLVSDNSPRNAGSTAVRRGPLEGIELLKRDDGLAASVIGAGDSNSGTRAPCPCSSLPRRQRDRLLSLPGLRGEEMLEAVCIERTVEEKALSEFAMSLLQK